MGEDLQEVAAALETAVARTRLFQRAVVVKQTASTQDAAASFGAGCVVFAGRQTAGRGRLGRRWVDNDGAGLAMTFAVGASGLNAARVSVAAGIAAARAVESVLRRGVGLKWPNDVVERLDGDPGCGGTTMKHVRGTAGRKIAGVLIEVRDGVVLIGVGINVGQRSWPEELRGRAVSLAELGCACARAEVGGALIQEMDAALALSEEEVVRAWQGRDTVVGTRRDVRSGSERYRGIVEDLDPVRAMTLRCEGGLVQLPVQSLVMERQGSCEPGA